MAFTPVSGAVSGGDDILASQYNNLRTDVLHASTGHDHDAASGGTPVVKISTACEFSANLSRPYIVAPPAFRESPLETGNLYCGGSYIKSNSDTAVAAFNAPVNLPNNAIVTSVKAFWYRDDADAAGSLSMYRCNPASGALDAMATVNSDATTGYHTVEDTTISYATIDNTAYNYIVDGSVDPNNASNDVRLLGVLITYTIIYPAP